MKRVEDSAFFCGKKNCRKTVWDTPEHLSEKDWSVLKEIVAAAQKDQREYDTVLGRLFNLDRASYDAFYDRMIGWPEGKHYWATVGSNGRALYFSSFVKFDLPKILSLLK